MGGFFGAVSRHDVIMEVFYGTDYHSHLGTKKAGIAAWNREQGFFRQIHSINSTPFRTKFENDLRDKHATSAIGCISDSDPQPLLVKSHLGIYAVQTVGFIGNEDELVENYSNTYGHQFMAMSNGRVNTAELVAALINEKSSIAEGILHVQDQVKGSMSVMVLTSEGEIIVSRDKVGRLPVFIGKNEDGYSVSFESFAFRKVGYEDFYELGPAEIVKITADGMEILSPAGEKMKICAFLWSYYGYPNATYEGRNVEVMRYRNGQLFAENEKKNGTMPDVDFVAGMPDSGIPHAIGYAGASGVPYARPFIKYTPTWPRSFMPDNQDKRTQVAKMKQIPVRELIEGKKLLFVDDSIVRGTQLRETVDFLYESGAEEVHMRSACPPIMHACKYLNFSRSNASTELLTRRIIKELEGNEGDKHLDEYADASTERGQCLLHTICEKLGFTSLEYQTLDNLLEAIGIDRDKVCTYCWTGKEDE